MIAQDVGGAIKGAVRGDLFWGTGAQALEVAGRLKQPGALFHSSTQDSEDSGAG